MTLNSNQKKFSQYKIYSMKSMKSLFYFLFFSIIAVNFSFAAGPDSTVTKKKFNVKEEIHYDSHI